ncbi:MAG: LbetaH domain-containing protein [Saccharofermentanales bacterium]
MNTDNIQNYTTKKLLNLEFTLASELFEQYEFPWEILPFIGQFIASIGKALPEDEYDHHEGNIWISKSAKIAPSASIAGPVIIGHEAEIRHCAFIRGQVIVGNKAIVGNSTELKNVILFSQVQVPHFNYVGDSILGHKSHMGAGAITSNVKSDKTLIVLKTSNGNIETGLRKFGAILGDGVEVGCNSVLNPGTVIGRAASIYPLSMIRGFIPADSIYKNSGEIVARI